MSWPVYVTNEVSLLWHRARIRVWCGKEVGSHSSSVFLSREPGQIEKTASYFVLRFGVQANCVLQIADRETGLFSNAPGSENVFYAFPLDRIAGLDVAFLDQALDQQIRQA